MVRVGEYEMRLVRPGGAPFDEVAGADGKAYAVAEPGEGAAGDCGGGRGTDGPGTAG